MGWGIVLPLLVWVLALFDGLVLQWLLDPDETPTGEELIDSLVRTMTLILEPNPEIKRRATRKRAAHA